MAVAAAATTIQLAILSLLLLLPLPRLSPLLPLCGLALPLVLAATAEPSLGQGPLPKRPALLQLRLKPTQAEPTPEPEAT